MTQITATTSAPESSAARAWRWLRSINPVYFITLVLLIGVGYLNPVIYRPDSFLTFLARATPLMILTAGQVFVLVSGGFDLSVGSVVTSSVIIAAILADNECNAQECVDILVATALDAGGSDNITAVLVRGL